MKIFDVSCSVIKTGSKNRRSALIAVLCVNHPDIEEYIDAKREEDVLTNFNISVGVTDEFFSAVENDRDWNLVFDGKVYKTVKARNLFDKLCYSGYMYNDPGLIMYDSVNKNNSMSHLYKLYMTNP